MPAERILLLTFTRRAAREMLARVDAPARRRAARADRVVGGTFHAVAWPLVRAHAAALGLPPAPTVLDAGDAADLIDLVREEEGVAAAAGRRMPRKRTLLDVYSRTVNAQRPLSEVVAEAFPWCARHARRARRAVPRVRRPQAGAGAARPRRPAPVLAGPGAAPDASGRCWPRASTTCWSTSTRTSTACRPTIVEALCAEHRAAHVRRRRPAGDLRLPRGERRATCWPSATASPTPTLVTLEQNYRSTAPILRDGQRRRRTRRSTPYPRTLRADDARRRAGRSSCGATTRPARPRPWPSACCAAREAGVELQRQAVLMRASHHSDAAGAGAGPPRTSRS